MLERDVDRMIRDLRHVDWDDADDVSRTSNRVIDDVLAREGVLDWMIGRSLAEPHLRGLAEHVVADRLFLFDKLVLHDEAAFRIRLHLFNGEAVEQPHSHRFVFTTRILDGGYRHAIFGDEPEFSEAPRRLRAARVAVRAGGGYTLRHTAVHNFVPIEDTISLMVRGPAMKTTAIRLAADGSIAHRHLGAALEPPASSAERAIADEQLARAIERLHQRGVSRR